MIQKSNKKLKFNIVDGVVLFLVVICISTIICRAVLVEGEYQQIDEKQCWIGFEIDIGDGKDTDVYESLFEYIAIGESVTALIADEKNENAETVAFGCIQKLEYSDDTKTKVIGYIIAEGDVTNEGFKIKNSNSTIYVEKSLDIFTERAITTIKIVSFEWK